MPFIIVEMWDGRTVDQKKVSWWKGLLRRLCKIGVPAEAVHIAIHDVPKHNWADGGKLASEPKSP
jgi:4-oxalocrotonate tautomerase